MCVCVLFLMAVSADGEPLSEPKLDPRGDSVIGEEPGPLLELSHARTNTPIYKSSEAQFAICECS